MAVRPKWISTPVTGTSRKNKMPTVTKLVSQLRDPSRVNVFLDGKYAFSLSAELVITNKLHKTQVLSVTEADSYRNLSGEEKVFARIINYISFRPRSVKEVRDRLYKYLGPEENEVKQALIARLEKLGYLNDLEFARWFAQSRRANRPRSVRVLASELDTKGISKEIITQVISDQGDDKSALRAIIAKKSRLGKDKLVPYLARLGFSWDMIKEELGP